MSNIEENEETTPDAAKLAAENIAFLEADGKVPRGAVKFEGGKCGGELTFWLWSFDVHKGGIIGMARGLGGTDTGAMFREVLSPLESRSPDDPILKEMIGGMGNAECLADLELLDNMIRMWIILALERLLINVTGERCFVAH